MHNQNRKNEHGNVLWFILIAVVMMGLLTAVLSRSGSSVDQAGDIEQARIKAGEIMRYAKSLEAAVQDMTFRGVSESDISFQNTISTTDYTNANCTTNECRIFHADGAGLTYKNVNAVWLDASYSAQTYYGDWLFAGNSCLRRVGSDLCAVPREIDLIVFLPFIRRQLCEEINFMVDLATPSGGIPADQNAAWSNTSGHFTGEFGTTGEFRSITDTDSVLFGRRTGCFEGNGTNIPPAGTYHFFHVLKAR